MIEKSTVMSDQNIVDLALQEMGSVEGLILFAKRNGVAVDQDPAVDSVVDVETTEVTNLTNRTFYKSKRIRVSTGRTVIVPDSLTADADTITVDSDLITADQTIN